MQEHVSQNKNLVYDLFISHLRFFEQYPEPGSNWHNIAVIGV